MIDQGFDMPRRNVIAFIVAEDYAKLPEGSHAIEREAHDVYMRVADIASAPAAFVRETGYLAWAHHDGSRQIQAIPALYHCGFITAASANSAATAA